MNINSMPALMLLLMVPLAPMGLALNWDVYNDPGNISADSGTIFSNIRVLVRYDGNCGPDAYLKTSGGCNSLNLKAESGGCFVNREVTGTVTLDSGGQMACVIEYSADYSSGPSGYKKSTIKINQLIDWMSIPTGNVSISDGAFDIDAQGTTADINVDDRTVTATVADTKVAFESLTTTTCSVTQFGRVRPLAEGDCTVKASVEGTDHLVATSATKSWSQFHPDTDKDGYKDNVDICPNDFDPAQTDTDASGIGDACNTEHDPDNDEYEFSRDNCPIVSNPDQKDSDKSGIGDACNNDIDTDNDEWENTRDNCETIPNPGDVLTGIQADADNDGLGDACDIDTDLDGILDAYDNCPAVPNADQADANEDSIGDVCAVDGDGDGVDDKLDNCIDIANSSQLDSNKNGLGNACEVDTDEDGIPDDSGAQKDNCPRIKNAGQEDSDGNGRGDACEVAFVSTSGSDANDCLSWVNACKTLQGGIDAAVFHSLPQVFVKKGAYTPATPINLKSGVKLIGGFAGTNDETLSTDANSSGNLTLISADGEYPNGDTLTDGVTATVAGKASTVKRGTLLSAKNLALGSANRVTVMGFTINASQDSALVVDNADVELINVKFVANEADNGAAIKAINGARVKMNRVVFNNNVASASAVVYVSDSDLTATQATFKYNLGASGSAIIAYGESKVSIDLSHFDQNISTGNGTISIKNAVTILKVTNTNFKQNTAVSGGAIYIADADTFTASNSLFENNHTSSGNGGAIVLAGNAATAIKQSSFIGNTAFASGGAITSPSGASMTIENVTFVSNNAGAKADGSISGQSGNGGVLDATNTNMSITITASTLVTNNASSEGGALAIDNAATGSLNLTANWITGNTAATGVNITAANGKIVDGGYNLLGFNGVSGLFPESAIDFSASSSTVGTSTLLTDILEIVPTLKGGDNYGSSLPVLPINKISEARNVIPNSVCPSVVDQRGEARSNSADDFCDIGAYEYTLLSCAEDVQRRQANGESIIKYCAPGFENIEFSIGSVHWYLLVMLSFLGLGLNFRRR